MLSGILLVLALLVAALLFRLLSGVLAVVAKVILFLLLAAFVYSLFRSCSGPRPGTGAVHVLGPGLNPVQVLGPAAGRFPAPA